MTDDDDVVVCYELYFVCVMVPTIIVNEPYNQDKLGLVERLDINERTNERTSPEMTL